jgi:hypothetical protein
MLATPLRLGLPSHLFPSSFLTNNLYVVLFSPIRATCPAQLILLDLIIRVQTMHLLVMQFPPTSRHFILLRSKYSPRHPVLKHPQSVFLP